MAGNGEDWELNNEHSIDGGSFFEIPRGPGVGVLKLRKPGPRVGGYFLVQGYGISRKKAREAYKSSRLDYELVQPCINRRPDYYMLLETLGKT